MAKPDSISGISLLLMLVFWASVFSGAVFEIIGQIKGQVILLVVWLVSLILFGKNAWRIVANNLACHNLELALILIFLLIHVVDMFLGNGNLAYIYFVRTVLFTLTFVTVVMHLRHNLEFYDKSVIFITLFFGACSFYIIPILAATPFIARLYEFSDGEIPWFGSWSYFMPIAACVPCFIAVSARQKGWLKVLLYICCISVCTMIILSTFAASIILLLMGLLSLAFFSSKNKVRWSVTIAGVVFVLILFVSLYDFSDMPQIGTMVEKIGTIFTYKADLAGDDNDPRIRASLMQISINTFLRNPFFGAGLYGAQENGNNIIGLHSGIVDSLAQYGIFGMMWFFGFLALGMRRLILYLIADPNKVNKARLIMFVLFIIGSVANPVLLESWFCSLVFILSLSPIGTGMDYDLYPAKKSLGQIYNR